MTDTTLYALIGVVAGIPIGMVLMVGIILVSAIIEDFKENKEERHGDK